MTVYHSSNVEIEKPDILHSRLKLDFGKGFYTTSLLFQAEKWAERFCRGGGGVANDRVFNTCELYFKHYIDKNIALDRLKYEKPNQQMCIKNQQTIDKYLHFERSRRR